MLYSPVDPPVQLSFRLPGPIGFAHLHAVRPGSPNPAIRKPVRRDARRLDDRHDSEQKQGEASVEDGYSAHPLGARKPIFLRPVATKRPWNHEVSFAYFEPM